MTGGVKSNAKVSCVLEISGFSMRELLEKAVSSGRHFSYAIPYISGETIKYELCFINLHNQSGGMWAPHGFYACIANSGRKVTTAQRILRLSDFVRVEDISLDQLEQRIPKRFHRHITQATTSDFSTLGDKTGQQLWDAVKNLSDRKAELEALEARTRRISINPRAERAETAAAEKDATGLCLEIAGLERISILKSWAPPDGEIGRSFLRGLPQHRAYEDDIIAHDLHTVPGWDRIESSITGIAEFTNEQGKSLIIINANRKPLENALGVDLIYFHRTFEAFTFVQYKMMSQSTSQFDLYYNPRSKQDFEELLRMRRLWHGIKKTNVGDPAQDYRLGLCPIFFKLCKRLVLDQDDGGISAGAYIPLDQWQKLLISPITKGPRGGRRIGYFNLNDRYLRTGAFVELVQLGLVGTKSPDTRFVGDIVHMLVAEGHSVLYAIEQQLRSRAKVRM